MKNYTEGQRLAHEERKARFRALVKKVAVMEPDERRRLADSMGAVVTCEGRALSLHNTCLIACQFPEATIVGGFRQWIKQGRAVGKGQHGLAIWIPTTRKVDGDQENDEPANTETNFIMGSIFDISQTVEIAESQEAA